MLTFGQWKGFKLSEVSPDYLVFLTQKFTGNSGIKLAAQTQLDKLIAQGIVEVNLSLPPQEIPNYCTECSNLCPFCEGDFN